MSDLAHLFQNAPGTAGFFVGQNQAQKNLNDILANRKLQEEMQQAALEAQMKQEMHPLKLQNQRLTNSGLEAGLGGILAESDSKRLKANRERETYTSDVAAANAKNQGTVDEESYNQFDRAQKTLMRVGAQLESVPAPMRGQAFRQLLQQSGINPDAKHFQQLANMDPNMLPKYAQALAEKLGQQALTMNPGARATMYSADVGAASRRYAADKSAAASRYATDERAKTARERLNKTTGDAKTFLQNVEAGKITLDKAAAIASINSVMAPTEEEKAIWNQVGAKVEQLLYNKANAGKQGNLQLDPQSGNLTPKTIPPVFGDKKNQTSDDDLIKKYLE